MLKPLACLLMLWSGQALAQDPTAGTGPTEAERAAAEAFLRDNCAPVMTCYREDCRISIAVTDQCGWTVTQEQTILFSASVSSPLAEVTETVVDRVAFGDFIPDALPENGAPTQVSVICSKPGCVSRRMRIPGENWQSEQVDRLLLECRHPQTAGRAATALDILVTACGGSIASGEGGLFAPKF